MSQIYQQFVKELRALNFTLQSITKPNAEGHHVYERFKKSQLDDLIDAMQLLRFQNPILKETYEGLLSYYARTYMRKKKGKD
jgi:hypothetical protein